MTVTLHTKVPTYLHPDGILSLGETMKGGLGKIAYDNAREALAELYNWYSDVEDVDSAFQQYGAKVGGAQYKLKGAFRTYHGSEEEIYNQAGKASERALTRASNSLNHTIETGDLLLKRLDKATDDPDRKTPTGIAMATEIRNHVKGLPEKQRLAFVQKAIRSFDNRTVAAVLKAPAYLSGIGEEAQRVLQLDAEKSWAPQDYEQFKAVQQIRETLEKGMGAITKRYHTLSLSLGPAAVAKENATTKLQRLAGRAQR